MYLRTSAVREVTRPMTGRLGSSPSRRCGQRHGSTDHEKEDHKGQSELYQQVCHRRQHALQHRTDCRGHQLYRSAGIRTLRRGQVLAGLFGSAGHVGWQLGG